jgi:septal ring factor EnvC (AmiA/AmiB activator)
LFSSFFEYIVGGYSHCFSYSSPFVKCKDSDEELKRMIKSFHCELEETKQQEQNLTEKLQKLQIEKSNLEKCYNQICEEFGKLTFSVEVGKSLSENSSSNQDQTFKTILRVIQLLYFCEHQQLKSLKEQRDNQIVKFSEEYKIKGYEKLPFINEQVKNFFHFAQELLVRAQNKIRETKVLLIS